MRRLLRRLGGSEERSRDQAHPIRPNGFASNAAAFRWVSRHHATALVRFGTMESWTRVGR